MAAIDDVVKGAVGLVGDAHMAMVLFLLSMRVTYYCSIGNPHMEEPCRAYTRMCTDIWWIMVVLMSEMMMVRGCIHSSRCTCMPMLCTVYCVCECTVCTVMFTPIICGMGLHAHDVYQVLWRVLLLLLSS